MAIPSVSLVFPLDTDYASLPFEWVENPVGVLSDLQAEDLGRLIELVDSLHRLRESMRERVAGLDIADDQFLCGRIAQGEKLLARIKETRAAGSAFVACWSDDYTFEPMEDREPGRLRVGEEGVSWEVPLGLGEGVFKSGDILRHEMVALYAALCHRESIVRLPSLFARLVEYDTAFAVTALEGLGGPHVRALPRKILGTLLERASAKDRLRVIAVTRHIGVPAAEGVVTPEGRTR